MCIPTVFSHALSPDIVARYVPVAMRGEEVWCQLFSEPSAGSDLAAARTRAERDGDGWVINGQKVWTSNAHLADYGIIVTRTDPTVPKHKGLTMFIVDMKAPGVEVRPIKQMSGDSGFNEVFFTDVRVDDSHRLGEVGEGWKVSLTTLMHERLAVGGKPSNAPGVPEMIALAKAIDLDEGSALEQRHVRERIARAYIADQGIALTRMRTLSALSSGRTPGPESSISKIVVAQTMQEMGRFASDLAESAGIVTGGDGVPELARFQGTISARRACASRAAPTKSSRTSSPNACSACPAISGSTRMCRSTRWERAPADRFHPLDPASPEHAGVRSG